VVAPVFSTGLIAAGLPWLWIGLLIAGSLGTAVLGLWLRRQLTAALDQGKSEAGPGGPIPDRSSIGRSNDE
jgi:hypothetical protein